MSARHWCGWVLAILCLLAFGCEPEPDVEPMACTTAMPATAELGGGDLKTGYVQLAQDDDVLVTLGPQGLHMIVVSVRLDDFELPPVEDEKTKVQVAMRHEGKVVGGAVEHLRPLASEASAQSVELLGLRAIFNIDQVDALIGQSAEVSVTIKDGCGRDIRADKALRLIQ